MSQPHEVHVHLAGLMRDLRQRENVDVPTALNELTASAAENVPGAQYAAALNMHAERPHSFNADALDVGRAYALHTALVWDFLRRKHQFRNATSSGTPKAW